LTIHLVPSVDECSDPGGGMVFDNEPVLRVTTLGIPIDRAPTDVHLGFNYVVPPGPNCPPDPPDPGN
jgi:hypothetical protein